MQLLMLDPLAGYETLRFPKEGTLDHFPLLVRPCKEGQREEAPMVDQLSKSAEEEAQLRKDALGSRRKKHGTGDRNVLNESNPGGSGSAKNKEGVSKTGDEQNLGNAVTRPEPDGRRE
jgi:hypothetical protein